ncbi:MAG: M20/M25/M40 family metallo-hydrolase [Bifidobacterium sp.]|uniref:M20/M25/M40 family metallo-hydrolase n=1 Tax=Bifidobacterium fermentum TaxID=3059035 RepID=A0AB39UKZ8_9BIFI
MVDECAEMTERAIELAKRLIAMPSVSGSREQDSTFGAILERVAMIPGASVRIADNRMSAICRTGVDDGSQSVVFVGHIDTVPPMDLQSWQSPPCEPEVREGRLFGRGSSDMKSGLAAALAVFERACHESIPCVVAITKDEEIGCLGAPSAVELLDGVNIAGMVIMESTDNIIRFGHRGALWLRATSMGKAAHGSNPGLGVNAILRMARAALQFKGIPLEDDPRLGAETCNLGTIAGGEVPNIVPDRCSATLDLRIVGDHSAAIVGYLKGLDTIDEVEVELSLAPVWTDPDDSWVASLRGRRDLQPVTYFTEASIFAERLRRRVPIIICGPGDPTCVHGVNESVPVDAIAHAAELYWSYVS